MVGTRSAPVGSRSVGVARYAELIRTLAERSLKVRYRGSILGVYWSLSNPLLMTCVYTLLFGAAFAKFYDNSVVEYMLAVFVGLAVLTFFTASTTQGLASVVSSGGLLNKVELPFSIFPLSFIAANAFQLAVGTLPLLIAFTIWRTHSIVHAFALIGPVGGLILLSSGFALFLSAVYVFFRDLPYLYEVFAFVLYMTSPIFYPLAFVPASIRPYVLLNPLASIVESTRSVVLTPGPLAYGPVLMPLVTGIVAVGVGTVVFLVLRNDFMDLL